MRKALFFLFAEAHAGVLHRRWANRTIHGNVAREMQRNQLKNCGRQGAIENDLLMKILRLGYFVFRNVPNGAVRHGKQLTPLELSIVRGHGQGCRLGDGREVGVGGPKTMHRG
jgi:hypothetical protein